MEYVTDGLTFNALRGANQARLPQFRNRHGDLAHSKPDGSDWSPAQWLQAVIGELGEYANIRKKHERGDLSDADFHTAAAKELADVQTYLDILAMQLGIDLGQATMDKFNEVSERVGSTVRLAADDWHYSEPMLPGKNDGLDAPFCASGSAGEDQPTLTQRIDFAIGPDKGIGG